MRPPPLNNKIMFIYSNVVLVARDDNEQKAAPIAIRISDIASFRGHLDTDILAPHLELKSAITLLSGSEVFLTASFEQLKKQIDPDSDGGLELPVEPTLPVLDIGQ
jgi:hypothetical protein